MFKFIQRYIDNFKFYCRVNRHKKDELFKRKIRIIKKQIEQFYKDQNFSDVDADYFAKRIVNKAIYDDRIDEIYSIHKEFLKENQNVR